MAFLNLLDHLCDVWRPVEVKVAGGDIEFAFTDDAPVATGELLALWPLEAPIGDFGAGFTPLGTQGGYMTAEADVELNDILEVTDGPDAPRRYRVTSPPKHPGRRFGRDAHHTEIVLEPYHGALPGDA